MRPCFHRLNLLFFVRLALTLFFALPLSRGWAQTSRVCGTNLAWARYWAPQIIFKDAFKQCAPWLTRNASSPSPWNTGVAIPSDSNGYPLSVPFGSPGQYVHTLIFNAIGGNYPAGSYTLLSEGIGNIQLEWDSGNQSFSSPCNNTFNVTPSNQGIHLIITASDSNDPVRNIRLVPTAYLGTYESEPFFPAFLNYIDSAHVFKAIRFMDLMNTNNSQVALWSDRTPRNYFTQANLGAGMNYEYLISLANTTQRDIWVNIPHSADDSFIQNFAQLIKDSLNPNLRVYIEYSNEVWNNIFQQNAYANTQGGLLGYTGQPWEQGWKYYAKRSADIHQIFEQVFGGGNTQLVKVISTQAGNSYVGNYILTSYYDAAYNPSGVQADALAIAPYFGNNLADSIGTAGAINTLTVPDLLQLMGARITNQVLPQVTAHHVLADSFSLDLIAYEGGSHVVATNSTYFNDTTLTAKILAANRDPQMEAIYCDYFDTWYGNGGGLFMNFTSPAFQSGQWASLSIIDHMYQPLLASYKWRAMNTCANSSPTGFGTLDPDLILSGWSIENSNLLHWNFPSHLANREFIIFRSQDGVHFDKLSSVHPGPDFPSSRSLEFVDPNPFFGDNLYEIRALASSGDFHISNRISLRFQGEDPRFVLSPNPSNAGSVLLANEPLENASISIVSLAGKEVRKWESLWGFKTQLDANGIPPGIYLVQIIQDHTVLGSLRWVILE